MAKDIKGVFQLFIQVTDSMKYEEDSDIELKDIFQNDSSIKKEISENEINLKKINNFELLIEKVDIFYIQKNRTQDYFIVGKDTEREEYTIILVWSSDTPAEKALIFAIDDFNKCSKKIFKKKNLTRRKMSIDINGDEEMIVFPAENYGQKNYDQQSIKYIDDSVKWLKISKTEGKLNDLDKVALTLFVVATVFVIIMEYIHRDGSYLSYFGGISIPMVYEILRRIAEKKEIRFSFKSFNTGNINMKNQDNVVHVVDPKIGGVVKG